MTACDTFLSAFSEVSGTGNFHSTGIAPFFFPKLHVKGLGELALPLPGSQAEALITLAEAAPYGMGEETVLDENVRKCWQIDAARLTFKSPQWKAFLDQTVARIGEDLGIKGKVSAVPYKLLIYGKGGHFRAHRDTEKLDAMFGTLIIALPSAHEGGLLIIRHDGREIEVDFSGEKHRHQFQFAAFFADCEHEVKPVRSGYRCCLAYNLRLDAGDPENLNLSLTDQARTLLPSLAAMKRERPGQLSAVLLEHSYTEANLSLRKLKGNDQARARALLAAAQETGFTAHLALVTFHQMGELEESPRHGRRRSRHDDDESQHGTMGEIYDESLSIEHWRTARDRRVELGRYRIEPDALISKEKFGEGEPDEKEAEGYTGNEGCTMEHWYRRAAIVLWAEDDHERILCRYNLDGACASLAALATGKNTGPGSSFHRLGNAIGSHLPDSLPSAHHLSRAIDFSGNPFVITLGALAKAGSRELLDKLLPGIPPSFFVLCGTPLWSKLHKVFGVAAFGQVYQDLIDENAQEQRRALFQILDALLSRRDAASWVSVIATRLAALAPKEPKPSYLGRTRDPDPPGDREETRILLSASHSLETPKARKAALAFLRADASLAYVREILGPVLLVTPIRKCLQLANSLAPEILAFAKSVLAAEVARPLVPFPDWTRPCPQPAARVHQAILELAAFMGDPAAQTHRFARPENERRLIEDFIRDHFLDLDSITIRQGRPHTLACTKNDKSHQHALARRAKEAVLLAKLVKP